MPKQRWSLGSRLIRFGSAPEPRVAILLCVLWLLVLQAYEPWHLSRGYRPSQILSGLGFFLWRIGFNASESRFVAVTVGLAVVVSLVYLSGWVVRSFIPHGLRKKSQDVLHGQNLRADAADVLTRAVPAITGALADSEVTWPALELALMESRLRGIRERWERLAGRARAMSGDELATDYERSLGIGLSAIEGRNGFSRDLVKLSTALIAGGDWKRVREFLSETFLSAAAKVTSVMDPEWFEEVRNDPKAKEALRIYEQLVEKSLVDAYALDEGPFCSAVGPLRAYYPLIAQDRAPNSSSFVVGLEKAYVPVLKDDASGGEGPEIGTAGKHPSVRIRAPGKRFKSVLGGSIVALAIAIGFVAALLYSWPELLVPRSETTVTSGTPFTPARVPSEVPPQSDLSKPDTQIAEVKPEELSEISPQPVSEHPPFSLPSGTWIEEPSGKKGHGVLKMRNGTDQDGAVKLVTSAIPRKVLWIMYIGAQREETVSGLAPGTYLLRFLLGRDWDPKNRTFLQGRSFYQAGKQLEFIETETDSGGQYTELNLTLNEVPGGNLPRDRITEAAFDEGDPGIPVLSAEPAGAR